MLLLTTSEGRKKLKPEDKIQRIGFYLEFFRLMVMVCSDNCLLHPSGWLESPFEMSDLLLGFLMFFVLNAFVIVLSLLYFCWFSVFCFDFLKQPFAVLGLLMVLDYLLNFICTCFFNWRFLREDCKKLLNASFCNILMRASPRKNISSLKNQ